ncbi:hypothetical protein SFRURICE_004922 [Spodoptera frugiperda]|nr:hypothetical protein SFRURICE_004922 [Spodoptera frugiperda]
MVAKFGHGRQAWLWSPSLAMAAKLGHGRQAWPRSPSLAMVAKFGHGRQVWPWPPSLAMVAKFGQGRQTWPRSPSLTMVAKFGHGRQAWPWSPSLATVAKHGHGRQVWSWSPTLAMAAKLGHGRQAWLWSPSLAMVAKLGHGRQAWPWSPSLAMVAKLGHGRQFLALLYVGGGEERDGGQAQVARVGEDADGREVGPAAVVHEPRRAAELRRVHAQLRLCKHVLVGGARVGLRQRQQFPDVERDRSPARHGLPRPEPPAAGLRAPEHFHADTHRPRRRRATHYTVATTTLVYVPTCRVSMVLSTFTGTGMTCRVTYVKSSGSGASSTSFTHGIGNGSRPLDMSLEYRIQD